MSALFPQFRHPPRTGYNRFKNGTWKRNVRRTGKAVCTACGERWEAEFACEHSGPVRCPACENLTGVIMFNPEATIGAINRDQDENQA